MYEIFRSCIHFPNYFLLIFQFFIDYFRIFSQNFSDFSILPIFSIPLQFFFDNCTNFFEWFTPRFYPCLCCGLWKFMKIFLENVYGFVFWEPDLSFLKSNLSFEETGSFFTEKIYLAKKYCDLNPSHFSSQHGPRVFRVRHWCTCLVPPLLAWHPMVCFLSMRCWYSSTQVPTRVSKMAAREWTTGGLTTNIW